MHPLSKNERRHMVSFLSARNQQSLARAFGIHNTPRINRRVAENTIRKGLRYRQALRRFRNTNGVNANILRNYSTQRLFNTLLRSFGHNRYGYEQRPNGSIWYLLGPTPVRIYRSHIIANLKNQLN
jgi:hypothetical protein